MAAAGDIITFIFNNEVVEGHYIITWNATHVNIHESVKVIPSGAFERHPYIVEVICHAGVERIERGAFSECPSLRRVIMLGVKVVERHAFDGCPNLAVVECPKLEIIQQKAFCNCSLRSINLPSAKVVESEAFDRCALTEAKFGNNLESIGGGAFSGYIPLKRITIPFKQGMLHNASFIECEQLDQVDLLEGVLHETISALQLEEWRNDLNAEINSINQDLPNAYAGEIDYVYYVQNNRYYSDDGDKARVIQEWMARLHSKIIYFKAEHRFLLKEAATTLACDLPKDIVMNSVLPFLRLPLHRFDGEVVEEGEGYESHRSVEELSSSEEEEDYEENRMEENSEAEQEEEEKDESSAREEGNPENEVVGDEDDGKERKRRKTATDEENRGDDCAVDEVL